MDDATKIGLEDYLSIKYGLDTNLKGWRLCRRRCPPRSIRHLFGSQLRRGRPARSRSPWKLAIPGVTEYHWRWGRLRWWRFAVVIGAPSVVEY